MKRLLFISIFLACLVSGFGQGSKFKVVNRAATDSVASSFTKDAKVIDGSVNQQLRSCAKLNPYRSTGRILQIPAGKIKKDSIPIVASKTSYLMPVEQSSVFIERERSQLRAAQMMSNEEATHAFFRENPSLHIKQPEKQIRIDRIDTDNLGMSHVKGVQLFRDIPVYGMDFSFHISSKTERFMGCTLNPELIDTGSALLSEEEAISIAESDLSQTTEIKLLNDFVKKMLKYEHPTATAIYYPDKFNNYRISYKVIIRPNVKDEWIYYIDAQSGEVVEKYNNTPTAGSTKGTGLDLFNVSRTVDTYEKDGKQYMINTSKPMFNAANFSGTITVLDNQCNLNSDLPEASSNSTQWNNPIAISMMYHATLVYDYLKKTFNRNSFDDKGADMYCIINVPDDETGSPNYDNAYWNGKAIWMGNGDVDFKCLVGGLDVVAHELGHAVVEYTAKLEYKSQSGAVNECYADIFGAMVDRDNWTIGEKIIKNRTTFPSGTMRDMSNPHNGGKSINDDCWQPAHVAEMYLGQGDKGGVHINCGIPNHAYYLYATATSKEKAEKVFYRALTTYLKPTSRFADLRIAATQAAKDLYGDADVKLLADAFTKVGILESSGSKPPDDLPVNPGQPGILLTNLNPRINYGLYKTTDYKTLIPLTTNKVSNKPSITDDGQFVLFINSTGEIRALDIAIGTEVSVSGGGGFSSVAVSRDGNRIAFIAAQPDAKIYVLDIDSKEIAAFQLYNPTTGTGGAQSGGVKYADAIEFDHSGEYIIYDAYNVVGESLGGNTIDYWDIGMLHVWDNNAKTFGSGQIEKLFSALEPGVSVGNPTFSKNSPYIMAFDFMNADETFATFGVNLATGDLDVMFLNNTAAYPNYSMDDKSLAFTSYDNGYFTGYMKLEANKISTPEQLQAVAIAANTAYPMYYGAGSRQLGVKPAAEFSSDTRSGKAPLSVQFIDMSENKPTSWNWSFQGGTPATSNLQNPKVTYSTQGTYPVKLLATNSYGNNELVKQGYITVGTTGIETTVMETVTISPNPARDYVWVQSTGCRVENVKISDCMGKTVPVSFANNNEKIRVDVSGLHPGIYLLQILCDDGKILIQKLIKK